VGLADEADKYPHEGFLDFVNNRLDPLTGTIQVRGIFPNPPPKKGRARTFTPGLFVRVRLPIGAPHPALLVPQAAIGTDQGRKYLLVVNDQNVVEYRPITVGPAEAGGMQVVLPVRMVRDREGLRIAADGEAGFESISPGDNVIIGGLQKVRQGDKVMIKDQTS
jgi:multidrug efflux pump subunit AcrA (membrane-fusion protein)